MNKRIEEFEKFDLKGFTPYCGLHMVEAADGKAVFRVDLEEHHFNPAHSVHGGLLFTLADTAGGYAVISAGEANCATASSSISYMRAGINCKTLIATAEVIKHGKMLSTAEVSVADENGKELIRMVGTYCNLDENYQPVH